MRVYVRAYICVICGRYYVLLAHVYAYVYLYMHKVCKWYVHVLVNISVYIVLFYKPRTVLTLYIHMQVSV